jgi:hypothetical protein
VHQPLVVVVDGDGESLLRVFLSDDVAVEVFDDFSRCGDIGKESFRVSSASMLLFENRLAQLDALAADVDVVGSFDKRADLTVALSAERTTGVLFAT